jgi:anthranilate phosphoribosyltransferase
VLTPDRSESAAKSIVEINAAAAIYLSGRGDNLREAYEYADDGIRSGHAMKKLNALVEASRQ